MFFLGGGAAAAEQSPLVHRENLKNQCRKPRSATAAMGSFNDIYLNRFLRLAVMAQRSELKMRS